MTYSLIRSYSWTLNVYTVDSVSDVRINQHSRLLVPGSSHALAFPRRRLHMRNTIHKSLFIIITPNRQMNALQLFRLPLIVVSSHVHQVSSGTDRLTEDQLKYPLGQGKEVLVYLAYRFS